MRKPAAQAQHALTATLRRVDGDTLVPVAKAYSGLDDQEILVLDKWIRAKHPGAFRAGALGVGAHVFELGFEAVNPSARTSGRRDAVSAHPALRRDSLFRKPTVSTP